MRTHNMHIRRHFELIFLLSISTCMLAQATSVSVTPSGAATGSCPAGTSSAPNLTAAQFNTSSYWGTGPGKIGPGTTVLLCGAFTDATPNDTLLAFQGSGSSGNQITLLFDTNASLTNSAYWGYGSNDLGAIFSNGNSYITINGGTNGLIQNTGNGTGMTYEHNSSGVSFIGGSNIIIENLTIANICKHTLSADTNGCTTSGSSDAAIFVNGTTNLTVRNNVVYYTNAGLYYQPPSGTDNALITGNTFYFDNWGIGVAYAASSGTASGITITNNNIYDPYPWDTSTDSFHHNGIMVYDTNGTGGLSSVVEANNYIHGNFGANNTAWIFNDDNTGRMRNFLIYNNVLVNGSSVNTVNNDYVTGVPMGSQVYNNTIWGNGLGGAISSSSGTIIENNLFANVKQFIAVASPTLVDYNQYMSAVGSGCSVWLYGGGPCTGQNSFAAWQAACSCDSHGAYNSADTISSNGTPQAGSPVIHAGSNLSGLSITALDSDHAGSARPSTGAWDIGAYELLSTPNPPTGMTGSAR